MQSSKERNGKFQKACESPLRGEPWQKHENGLDRIEMWQRIIKLMHLICTHARTTLGDQRLDRHESVAGSDWFAGERLHYRKRQCSFVTRHCWNLLRGVASQWLVCSEDVLFQPMTRMEIMTSCHPCQRHYYKWRGAFLRLPCVKTLAVKLFVEGIRLQPPTILAIIHWDRLE